MRLSNGFVIDKEKTFGELKFTAVRDVFSLSITNPFDNLINASLLYFSSTATISSASNT